MACTTHEDWRATLERYISDEEARKNAGQKGKAFVERCHSEEKLLAKWDEVFQLILGKTKETSNLPSHLGISGSFTELSNQRLQQNDQHPMHSTLSKMGRG